MYSTSNSEDDRNNNIPDLFLCGKHENYSTIKAPCGCPPTAQLQSGSTSELAKTEQSPTNSKLVCIIFKKENVDTLSRFLIPPVENANKFDTYKNALLLLCRFYSRDNLIDLAQLLINLNSTIATEKTEHGSSALLVLCAFYNRDNIVQVAELLKRNGVSVNEKGKYGYNALMALFEYFTSEKID